MNLNLDLGVHLDHHDNLVTGIHQFGMGQHTSATRKVLQACSNQN